MSVPGKLICGRCARPRWSSAGVCSWCGYDVAIPHPIAQPDAVTDAPEKTHTGPARPWITLLLAGLLAIAIGQLLFHQASGESLPVSAVVSTLLGIGLVAAYSALLNFEASKDGKLHRDRATEVMFPSKHERRPGLRPIVTRLRENELRLAGPVIGVVLLAVLTPRVIATHGTVLDIALWVVSIAGFAAIFAPAGLSDDAGNRIDLRALRWASNVRSRLLSLVKSHLADVLPLLTILLIYCAVTVPNLTAWRYSVIGDEYLFYEHAAYTMQEGVFHAFSQNGVYDYHPVLNTIYKAAVMGVFGEGHFGWKMGGVVAMMLATAGVYALGYALGNRTVAMVAGASFAFSHYLLGLVNGGYNHTEALPTTVWALALFVIGLRQRNPLLLYLAGALVGLGLYLHYSARIVGPVMLLTALVAIGPRKILALWPVALGFLMTAWPTLLVAQEEIVTNMLSQSVGGYSEAVSGQVAERLKSNLLINLPAFHFNGNVHTYVSGPLLEPLTGALTAAGVGFTIGRPTQLASKLLLIWLAVAFVATGLTSPYPVTAITRLFPLVAPLAILAGIAADRLLGPLPALPSATMRRIVPGGALVALLVIALLLNVNRAWSSTHSVFHYSQEALAVGAARHEYCSGTTDRIMLVGSAPGSALDLALRSYRPNSFDDGRLTYFERPAPMPLPEPAPNCVIFVNPDDPEARAMQSALRDRYPEGELFTFTTSSHRTRVEFFHLNGPDAGR